MSDTPNAKRLSMQDLAVIVSVSAISLLALGLLFDLPLFATLLSITVTSTILLGYGLMKKATALTHPIQDQTPPTDEDYLAIQANMADNSQDVTQYMPAHSQRTDFLANASHELKTPIASILGYIETLQGHAKNDPEAQEKFLGIMQSQAERMQRLINDLLSLRRIEQNEHIAPNETADVYFAAKSALETIEPLAEKRGINITMSGDKSSLIMGHQDEIIQLVLNLLDNAVKISPPKSAVTLSIEHLEHWTPGVAFTSEGWPTTVSNRRIVSPAETNRPVYVLRIRDQGPGFNHIHIPRIGERFYRIAGDLSSQEKGTGLGLAIVKHITLRHRGGLLIQSAVNEGTEFTVILPAANHNRPVT